MLRITIPAVKGTELWDEGSETFVKTPDLKEQTLQLEHSLVSISKWESKWCKPFISKKEKTDDFKWVTRQTFLHKMYDN